MLLHQIKCFDIVTLFCSCVVKNHESLTVLCVFPLYTWTSVLLLLKLLLTIVILIQLTNDDVIMEDGIDGLVC